MVGIPIIEDLPKMFHLGLMPTRAGGAEYCYYITPYHY